MSQDPGHACAPVLSASVPSSLYLRLMALSSQCVPCSQVVSCDDHYDNMTSSWSPPSDCRCRPSRRQSRSSGTRWRAPVTEVGVARTEICIGWNSASPILLLFLLIHLTDGRALANAQQPCEVRCSPDNNCESYIQYLSRHLSYHKRGVEEGDDSIRY